jgi:hypothetical protein
MSIRSWVIRQLRKDSERVVEVGDHGVRILRPGRPDAVAYCVEPDGGRSFSVPDLEDAVQELPEAGMVVITRRAVDPEVYKRAGELGVCVDTFGGLGRAIHGNEDISEYMHPEEIYIRKRLMSTRFVSNVARIGQRAWAIDRRQGLRQLTIVTHERYELTDDGFAEVLSQYPELELDALVITNPSAQGFGRRVATSAQQAGVRLYTLNEFVAKVRDPWT